MDGQKQAATMDKLALPCLFWFAMGVASVALLVVIAYVLPASLAEAWKTVTASNPLTWDMYKP